MAQFLRIASEPAPDLRENGIPDDIADLVERAMSRDPKDRPTAAALGEELQRLQRRHGFTVDEMALRAEPRRPHEARRPPPARSGRATFPGAHQLRRSARRVGRGEEPAAGVTSGDVDRDRWGRQDAAGVASGGRGGRGFADGVCLVELGELRDGSLLVDVVAAGLGLRDESARRSATC